MIKITGVNQVDGRRDCIPASAALRGAEKCYGQN